MMESYNYYTEEMVKTKLGTAQKMLEELDDMTLEELKENYLYYLEEPLFFLKYDPYNKDTLKKIKAKEDLISYFKLGLNMLIAHLKNYKYLDIL